MTDEIKKRVVVEDDASGKLGKIAEGAERINKTNEEGADVADKATQSTRKQTDAVEKQSRATEHQEGAQRKGNEAVEQAATQLAGLGAAFLGANGVIELYDRWIERIEIASQRLQENAAIARENAEARLDLVALQGVESIDQVNAINTTASFAGRRPGEVAQLGTFLTSQLPTASADEINQLALTIAGVGRTSTAPLTELATGILPLFRKTGDARVASNIFVEGVRQAGEPDVGTFGQVLGENISLIEANAGVDIGESAGLIAAGTGVGIESRSALTALNAVNFSIRGLGTPDGNKVFERLGITDRSDVLGVLEQLVGANAQGDLSTADIEALGGREAAPLFAILSDPEIFEDFRQRVRAVDAREDFGGDLARDNASAIFSSSSIQNLNILAKSFEAEGEGIRAGDVRAVRADAFRTGLATLLDAELAKPDGGPGNITPELAERIKEEFEFQIGRGLEPEEAVRIAEDIPRRPVDVPGLDGPARGPNGRQLRGDAAISNRDDVSRDGAFSVPLRVLVNRGAPSDPGLLADEAEAIRQRVNEAIREELGDGIIFTPIHGDPDDTIERVREREINALGGLRASFPAGEGQRTTQQRIEDLEAAIRRLEDQRGTPQVDDFIEDATDRINELQRIEGASQSTLSGATIIEHQTVITGTQINNSSDPATGDRELGRQRRRGIV